MKKIYYCFCLLLMSLLLGACFSPWQGNEDNLIISWDGSDSSRAFVQKKDLDSFRYTVTLTGPGGTISQRMEIGDKSVSFSVEPGTWNVMVIGGQGVGKGFRLKVMGIEQVIVPKGRVAAAEFFLYTATEVSSWEELEDAVEANNKDYWEDERTEMIFLTDDLTVPQGATEKDRILIERPIIFVADKQVNIAANYNFCGYENPSDFTRASSRDPLEIWRRCFFSKYLTLGKEGMNGSFGTTRGKF